MEKRLELFLLGKPRLCTNGGELTAEQISTKGQALLIYLAVTGQPHSRSALAGLLWGDMPEESARANLRLTLTKLRKALDGAHLRATRLEIGLDDYWLDLTDFQTIAQTDLQRACELYRGDFLEGFDVPHAAEFELWLLGTRQHVRATAVSALYRHVENALATRQFELGIQAGRKLLAIEPWHEEAHRQLMLLLAASGQRSAALAQYDTCRRILADELDVAPAPATVELVEQIKAGLFESPAAPVRITEQRGAIYTHPPPAPRHNLPSQLTPLVGRDTELAQIAELLANPDCRLLTLIGPGGIGKTRLALAVGEAQIEAFRDGVRFVSLVGVLPSPTNDAAELLVTAIANALDYTFTAQQPPRDLLLLHLAGQHILLILDNFEQLSLPADREPGSAAGLLLDLLAHAPGVKLLLASQQRLGVQAEWLFDVKGLPYPQTSGHAATGDYPAVQLFTRSVQRLRPDFDPAAERAAIHYICQLVEGFPLGLELAAGWARLLSCAEIAAKLEEARSAAAPDLEILATSLPGASGRHQSMRVVLDYAWRLLSEDEQHTFRRLAVFRGGFELAAAVTVAATTLPVLAGLMDKSWLRQDEDGRYRIHDLVRQYAAGQLAAHPDEQANVRQEHARAYAEFLETRRGLLEKHVLQPALAELDREVENIRAAWEWHVAHGEIEAVCRYVDGLWRYYQHKGWFQEAVVVLNQVCALRQVAPWQQARWQRWLGDACYQMGELQKSGEYLAQAMACLGRPLPPSPTGWLLTLVQQGLRQAVYRLWPRRFNLPAPEEQRTLAEGSRTLGGIVQVFFFTEQAIPLFAAALYDLNLAEQAGAAAELARGYSTVGYTLANIPLHKLARHYCRLAQAAVRQTDRLSVRIYSLQVIGMYKLGLGQWKEATQTIEESIDLLDRVEMRRWWEESWALLAKIAYYQGHYATALAQYGDVLASARYRGDYLAQCWALAGMAHCGTRLGPDHDERVLAWLEEAKTLPEQFLALTDRMNLNGALARAYLDQGRPALAWKAAEEAAQLAKQANVPMFWALEGYAGPAEVFLSLWEASLAGRQVPADRAVLAQSARQICRGLRTFANLFPFGWPQAWLYHGLCDWYSGNTWRARWAWGKSLAAAEQLGMPYEQGRAHFEIGRHLPHEDPARRHHLLYAAQFFTRLQAAHYLAQTQDALQSTG